MVKLDMDGSYDLTEELMEEKVQANKIGNYALGRLKKNDDKVTFVVKYVGRSDDCLRGRLKDHVGNYDRFKFSVASTAKEAFEKECCNYHDFGESKTLDNEIHPDRPEGENWKCPRCKNFG